MLRWRRGTFEALVMREEGRSRREREAVSHEEGEHGIRERAVLVLAVLFLWRWEG